MERSGVLDGEGEVEEDKSAKSENCKAMGARPSRGWTLAPERRPAGEGGWPSGSEWSPVQGEGSGEGAQRELSRLV